MIVFCLWYLICACSCDDNVKATPGPQSSSLASSANLYISVKTSAAGGNHARRPLALLRSWANTRSVREHTFFFTDAEEHDPALLAMSGARATTALPGSECFLSMVDPNVCLEIAIYCVTVAQHRRM